LSPQDCATYTFTIQVGDVPEGYYYIYIVADQGEVIAECDEANNWTRSDDPVHVVPDTSEPI
jgi:hypothetical protein